MESIWLEFRSVNETTQMIHSNVCSFSNNYVPSFDSSMSITMYLLTTWYFLQPFNQSVLVTYDLRCIIFVLLLPRRLGSLPVDNTNLFWVDPRVRAESCSSGFVSICSTRIKLCCCCFFPFRPPSTAKSISIPGREHTLQLDCKGEGTAEPGTTGGGVSLGRSSAKHRPSIVSSGPTLVMAVWFAAV